VLSRLKCQDNRAATGGISLGSAQRVRRFKLS
jgi:hypothetical protein